MKMIVYLYIVLFSMSLFLLYLAFGQYNVTKKLLNNGIRTKATVVSLIRAASDNGYTYKPVFEYKGKGNNIETFKSNISSSPAAYEVGEKVAIIYSKRGKKRKIISFWGLYGATTILLSIAAPMFIIGGGYLLYRIT